MLSPEDSAVLTHVGPGTIMGSFMRQYWIPGILSSELLENDGAPLRVRLLCEDLIAFRDSSGRVGLIQNACPHRGASLFFGRNEEDGLRCVYHGWKYDVTGQCVDMPSEPAESNFKDKIRATAYPCVERNGMIWVYMGPRTTPPPLPDFEPNMLADGQWSISCTMTECNYFQSLEGDIDTVHAQFLHHGRVDPQEVIPGTFRYYRLFERAARYQMMDTEFGTMYGAYRPAEPDTTYWRIAYFLFPFYAMAPTSLLGHQIAMQARVPIDDEHTLRMGLQRVDNRAPGQGSPRQVFDRNQEPPTTDWLGRFPSVRTLRNDYLVDRALQKTGDSFTGIDGIPVQDMMATESMGPIYDRSKEHLGTSDAMIIRTRRRLIEAARRFDATGETPPGVDNPEIFRVRAGGVILPNDADWLQATDALRQAFVEHPGLDPAIVG